MKRLSSSSSSLFELDMRIMLLDLKFGDEGKELRRGTIFFS